MIAQNGLIVYFFIMLAAELHTTSDDVLRKIDFLERSKIIRRVENALNSIDGVWASVKLEYKSVFVRSKNQLEEKNLSQIISQAGYTLIDFK